jgi:threonine dehydratase
MGSFKPRGGMNLVGVSTAEERKRGFITASSGNHGQSICVAAKTFGSHATVVVPENINPVKLEAMESLGAKVIKHGPYFDVSNKHAIALSKETGMRYVHAVNEPLLIAGVGTYSLEIHEDLGQVDYILVPVGGGSGASGACIVSASVSPGTKVIGVQAAAAPAVYESWRSGNLEQRKMETAAEGLATGQAYELTVGILRKYLHDFILVSEEAILRGIELFLRHTRSLVEHAGATTVAAAAQIKEKLRGKRVVLIATGANLTLEQLRGVIAR